MLVTSAVLTVPDVARTLVHYAAGLMLWDRWYVPMGLLTWAAMFIAAIAAWVGRPRGGWRDPGEVPVWLLAPIVLASAPLLVPEVMAAGTDGAPLGGWYVTHFDMARGVGDVMVISLLLAVVAVATAVLLQLRRRVAAAVLLAAAGPRLVLHLTNLVETTRSVEVQVMLGGVAAVLGSAILVVVATRWLTRDHVEPLGSRAEERSLPNR